MSVLNLAPELQIGFMSELDPHSLQRICETSKLLQNLCKDEYLFQRLTEKLGTKENYLHNWRQTYFNELKYKNIFEKYVPNVINTKSSWLELALYYVDFYSKESDYKNENYYKIPASILTSLGFQIGEEIVPENYFEVKLGEYISKKNLMNHLMIKVDGILAQLYNLKNITRFQATKRPPKISLDLLPLDKQLIAYFLAKIYYYIGTTFGKKFYIKTVGQKSSKICSDMELHEQINILYHLNYQASEHSLNVSVNHMNNELENYSIVIVDNDVLKFSYNWLMESQRQNLCDVIFEQMRISNLLTILP